MKYTTSITEIRRRKLAYISLVITLILGMVSGSYLFNFVVSIYIYLAVFIALFLLGLLSFKFFNYLNHLSIILTTDSIQRAYQNKNEKFFYKEIRRVEIKWNKKHRIREIYIWLNNGQSIFITALQQFTKFKTELLNKLHHVKIKEIHEPIDYDHPLFYPVLGLSLGHLSILTFKLLFNLSYQQFIIGKTLFLIYVLCLGIYFCWFKPISKRTGNHTVAQDYVLGGVMIMMSIGLLWWK